MTPILVLTRPAPASERFAARIAAVLDVPTIISPALRLERVPFTWPDDTAVAVFTSANAIENAGPPPRRDLRAYCVGPRTSAHAKAAGFDAIDGGGDAQRLTRTLLRDRPNGHIVHPHGRHTTTELSDALQAAGLNASGHVCYEQHLQPANAALQSAAAGNTPLVLPFFSPRSSLILAGLAMSAPRCVVAISASVAEAAQGFDITTLSVADRPDEDAMVDATINRISALTE